MAEITASEAMNDEQNLITPGGVFISHVHEDEPLAEAFSVLITDVTGGAVPTFRSSSKEIGEGIRYGEEWFRWICSNVERARHIVAIITSASIGRPWILFEAGLGKAKPEGSVFGLGIGITREEAYQGPFATLQNCGTEEKELMKLCKELVTGTSSNPRDEAIKRCVTEFRERVGQHIAVHKPAKAREDSTSVAVFQALEDMKSMLRDQGRMFESSMPLRSPRIRRPLRRITMLLEDAPHPLSPEVQLVISQGMAEELGLPLIASVVNHILYGEHVDPDFVQFALHYARELSIDRDGRVSPEYMEAVHVLCRNIEEAAMSRCGRQPRKDGPAWGS